MSTDYILEIHENYLHVKLADDYEITPEGMQRQWSEVIDVCRKNNLRLVLSEGKIAKRKMTTMDAFQSGDTLAKSTMGLSLACCFYGYIPDDLSRFFETVSWNRGVKVKFFSDRLEALRWLGVEMDKQ